MIFHGGWQNGTTGDSNGVLGDEHGEPGSGTYEDSDGKRFHWAGKKAMTTQAPPF
jgi:hypothetical protein